VRSSMGSIQDEWASDAEIILGEIPKAVTVSNGAGLSHNFNVLIDTPMVQQDLETGGFLNSASFDVKFLKTDSVAYPTLIQYGCLMQYNGKSFRIVAVNDRPPSAWVMCRVVTKTGPG